MVSPAGTSYCMVCPAVFSSCMVCPAGCIFCSPLGDLASALNGILVSRFGRCGTCSGLFFTEKCGFANGGLPSCISPCDHCTTLLVSGAGLAIETYLTRVTCTRVFDRAVVDPCLRLVLITQLCWTLLATPPSLCLV